MRILVILALIGLSAAAVNYAGHQVYRVFPTYRENELIKKFAQNLELDFWSEYQFAGDFVDFRVSPQLRSKVNEFLSKRGIKYEIFVEDVGVAIAQERTPRSPQLSLDVFDYNMYHTIDEINNWINLFTDAHELAQMQTVGSGMSNRGVAMKAIKISTGAGRRAFVINCGIHAREWITPATCMYTANKLVDTYKNNVNNTITNLMNSVDFYLIPSSNPDGYAYTWTNDRMWRKTRSQQSNCACLGVDPNRNWDSHWGGEGSSGLCCTDTYHGPSAFSEIETQNQRDFVNGIENVKAYIDVHAYSQMWMYPYGYTTNNSPDEATLKRIGDECVNAIASVNGKKFVTGSIADVIYVATGSTADYFYDQGIKCSWAAELRDKGFYGFNLPESQINAGASEAFEGLMVIAKNVADGSCD